MRKRKFKAMQPQSKITSLASCTMGSHGSNSVCEREKHKAEGCESRLFLNGTEFSKVV